MNIIQQQEMLKDLSDPQIAQEMQQPSGRVPLYLVSTEAKRRSDLRQRFKADQAEPPQTTVQEDLLRSILSQETPPTGIAAGVGGDPRQQPPSQGMPQNNPQPQMQPPMVPPQPPAQGIMAGGNAPPQQQPRGFANGGGTWAAPKYAEDPVIAMWKAAQMRRNAARSLRESPAPISGDPRYAAPPSADLVGGRAAAARDRRDMRTIAGFEDPLSAPVPIPIGGLTIGGATPGGNVYGASGDTMAGADMSGYPGSGIPILPGRVPYAGPSPLMAGRPERVDRPAIRPRGSVTSVADIAKAVASAPFREGSSGANAVTDFFAPKGPYADDDIEGMDNYAPGGFEVEQASGLGGLLGAEAGARSVASPTFPTPPVPRSKPERESLRAGGTKTDDALGKNITPSATSGASYDENYLKNLKAIQGGDDPFASIEKRAKAREAKLDARANSDMWMSVAKAGFAMAAGTSQYAMTNIAAGAGVGLAQYDKDRAAANKSRERIDASRDALDIARVGEARAQRGDAHRLTAGQTQDRQHGEALAARERSDKLTNELRRDLAGDRIKATERISKRSDTTQRYVADASLDAALGTASTKAAKDLRNRTGAAIRSALKTHGDIDPKGSDLPQFLATLKQHLGTVTDLTEPQKEVIMQKYKASMRPGGTATGGGGHYTVTDGKMVKSR